MKAYLLRILCLLGFAPEMWLLGAKKARLEDHPQIQLGLFLNLLFWLAFIFFLVVQVLAYYIEILPSNLDSATLGLVADILDVVSSVPLALCCGLFVISLLPFVHSPLPVSLIRKPFRSAFLTKFSLVWGIISQLIAVLFIGICFRASYLARPHPETPSIYMLYENAHYMGGQPHQVPEWIFALGFYPIAETAASRWGDTSIAVEPLSRDSLKRALQHGRLIFIASHGEAGTISMSPRSYDNFFPADIYKLGGTGPNLQFVYIAGCEAGKLKADWQQALAPARLIIFERISWYVEHIYWLWFSGPQVVSELR